VWPQESWEGSDGSQDGAGSAGLAESADRRGAVGATVRCPACPEAHPASPHARAMDAGWVDGLCTEGQGEGVFSAAKHLRAPPCEGGGGDAAARRCKGNTKALTLTAASLLMLI
jgi:hypothetical protein